MELYKLVSLLHESQYFMSLRLTRGHAMPRLFRFYSVLFPILQPSDETKNQHANKDYAKHCCSRSSLKRSIRNPDHFTFIYEKTYDYLALYQQSLRPSSSVLGRRRHRRHLLLSHHRASLLPWSSKIARWSHRLPKSI